MTRAMTRVVRTLVAVLLLASAWLPLARAQEPALTAEAAVESYITNLLAEMEGIKVIRHEKNQGYGAGLRSAFQYTIDHGYDALVTIDCDGQHQPKQIPEIAQALWPKDGSVVDIVSGSRYLKSFDGDSLPPEARRKVNVEITAQLNKYVYDNYLSLPVVSLGSFYAGKESVLAGWTPGNGQYDMNIRTLAGR